MRNLNKRSARMAVIILAFGTAVQADDSILPLDKVPAAAMRAIKAMYPKAEIVAAEKGDQDGKPVYEFDLKAGDKRWEASFTSEGKFVSAEEPMKMTDLPAPVRDAFSKKYAEAKVVSVEKETTGEGPAAKVVYEIVIERDKGKVEAQFDPTGKFIAEEKVK